MRTHLPERTHQADNSQKERQAGADQGAAHLERMDDEVTKKRKGSA